MSNFIRNSLIGLLLSLNTALAADIHLIDRWGSVYRGEVRPYFLFDVDRVYDCQKGEEDPKSGIPITVYDKNENLVCKTMSDEKAKAECRLNNFGLYTIFVNNVDSVNYKPKYPTLSKVVELTKEKNLAYLVIELDNCE